MDEGEEVRSVGNGTVKAKELGAPWPEMNGVDVKAELRVPSADVLF